MGKGGQHTVAADAPVVPTAEGAKKYVLAPKATFGEWYQSSIMPADTFVSPFSKWTEEDWKTRVFPTRSELKAVIPEHCFQRSAIKGFGYIARDILEIAFIAFVYYKCGLSADLPNAVWKYPFWVLNWALYGMVQGGFATGFWVMGHECGHYAFSDYPMLNDAVGWVIHSMFLTPYFSWQFSHGKHHRRTNHMMQGESHVPDVKGERHYQLMKPLYDMIGHRPFAVFNVWYHLTLAYPIYFLGLLSGGRIAADGTPIERGEWTDHYRPSSRLYPQNNPTLKMKVIISDVGLIIMYAIIVFYMKQYGILPVLLWYGLPCFCTDNVYLVFATWLQHTHDSIPHFGEDEWTWVKGAVAGTIDRPHPIFDIIAHHITSTHVCHHLFPELPHYGASEATRALKAYLEPKGMYNCDPVDQAKICWLVAKTCHYMDSEKGIVFYKSLADADKDDAKKKAE